jgi:hypothetical protein
MRRAGNTEIQVSRLARLAGWLVALSVSVALAQDAPPRVPAGLDPGGVAVAIIGAGADYTRPDIAARLARDGEGDLVGWDFTNNQPRPYVRGENPDAPYLAALVAAVPPLRLILARVAQARQDQIALGLRFAGATPARIALVTAEPGAPLRRTDLEGAARQLPRLLIVVPADRVAATAEQRSHQSGLLVVAAAESGNAAAADVLVREDPAPATGPAANSAERHARAATTVTALAAALFSGDPSLTASDVRDRVLAQARKSGRDPPELAGRTVGE